MLVAYQERNQVVCLLLHCRDRKVKVPEIRELPPTDSTLSSEQDTTADIDEEDTTLATATNQSLRLEFCMILCLEMNVTMYFRPYLFLCM